MFWIPDKVSDFLTIIASKSLPVIADFHHVHRIENYCSTSISIPVSASIPNSVIEIDTFSPERFLSTISQSIRERMWYENS